ncbi:uncharacterized protein EV422DRAFT_501600 [Fimicolochytrium jonesii]|uniref:uncharacterized protein n=1 Tax=Fimicolochytrium jonesii TaxID=1396493 RepID=UPI0022FF0242|nr:uncharacterized protein EV422DRAFT_501600 [Fimicolochytrium jonesii]KAI8816126.1 hypothetical protein EV422DRAFT_501600 [Fimicolochytrium jonesii]
MEGWFLGANYYSIKKENIKTWVAWAFMDQDLETLDEEKVDEVEKLVSTIERYSHHSFPPGRNDNIRCIRLNIDAMQTTHRPWIYYAVCKGIGAIAHICVRALGYYQRSIRLTGTAGDVATFWYRPATRPAHPSAVPVVFIHGIGIGFCQYLAILAQLPRNVPVYLLEWAHVSMQLSEEVPTIEHTLELISCVLTLDSVARACFVAHSLGTVAVSWIIHSSQHSSLVASAVLLDPVNLLLCDPKVAFNFLYRTPANSLELAMNYFVSREMYIANALSRHFHWSRNIMFYDDLPKCENGLTNVVMLSDLDSIVPSERVKAYLEASAAAEGGKGKVPMELIYHTNQHHGQILIRMDRLAEIAKHVGRACGATAVETEPLQSVFAG